MSMSSSLSSALIGVEMPVATMSKSVFNIPKTRYLLLQALMCFFLPFSCLYLIGGKDHIPHVF